MKSQGLDKKLLVIHNNSGMSSEVDEILFCGDVAYLDADVYSVPASDTPNLILQDCKVMGDNYVLICRDLREEDKLRGAPVIVATSQRSKKAPSNSLEFTNTTGTTQQDMKKMASMINNLLSIFGFTYLVMSKPGKIAVK
jgi:PleD family two-component response regulator